MLLETEQDRSEYFDPTDRQTVSAVGALPAGVVFTERATAMLRAYLISLGLGDWRIFYNHQLDLGDIDAHLIDVDEAGARWKPARPLVDGGEPLVLLEQLNRGARLKESGFLRLEKREVIVARWFWLDAECMNLRYHYLAAAPTVQHYTGLRQDLAQFRRRRGGAVWQFVTGASYRDGPRTPRDGGSAADALVLPPQLRQRIESDVVRFFSEEVAALYRSLGVPYRRGVLLHGPPGNGKTSLIRMLGAALPTVPFLVLRADAAFDADDFQEVVRRWKGQAPAALVLEDLNWLLKTLNISTFLNLLDGIDSAPSYGSGQETAGGLLLIATTNHPEALDPAINNRPGRFDVVIEISSPTEELRRRFLQAKLPAISAATIERVVSITDRLSFAHLQELLRLSGLLAIANGRSERIDADVLKAAEDVRCASEQAARGFPAATPEVPFGLGYLRTVAR